MAHKIKGRPPHTKLPVEALINYLGWKANLRILEVEEIKALPYTPMSHPFVERLIGTLRREYFDHVTFWNARDLERKLEEFRDFYNFHRVHSALGVDTPAGSGGEPSISLADLHQFQWQGHCRGLFQLPIAA